jgi:hypothetical protein
MMITAAMHGACNTKNADSDLNRETQQVGEFFGLWQLLWEQQQPLPLS